MRWPLNVCFSNSEFSARKQGIKKREQGIPLEMGSYLRDS